MVEAGFIRPQASKRDVNQRATKRQNKKPPGRRRGYKQNADQRWTCVVAHRAVRRWWSAHRQACRAADTMRSRDRRQASAPPASIAARRAANVASSIASLMPRLGMSISMLSPSSPGRSHRPRRPANVTDRQAGGAEEKRPSVSSAQALPGLWT